MAYPLLDVQEKDFYQNLVQPKIIIIAKLKQVLTESYCPLENLEFLVIIIA
jgi:hypothetical protein